MINDTGYKLVNTMRRYNGKLSAIGKIFCFEKTHTICNFFTIKFYIIQKFKI